MPESFDNGIRIIRGETIIIKYPPGSASATINELMPLDFQQNINEYSDVVITDTFTKITNYESNPNI